MVTINKINLERETDAGEKYILVEISCLSTDTKPKVFEGQKVDNGSVCIEVDTQKISFYNLEDEKWEDE